MTYDDLLVCVANLADSSGITTSDKVRQRIVQSAEPDNLVPQLRQRVGLGAVASADLVNHLRPVTDSPTATGHRQDPLVGLR